MSIKIVTDSASDITPREAEELGIQVLPLTVTFGSSTYHDGTELEANRFYEMLIETDDLPSTSQVPPADYEAAFADAEDGIICVTISSKLSGCFQSANIAAQGREDIFITDSLSASVGERILVLRALELIKSGLSARETAARLEEERQKVRLIGLVDTLEYLKRGGRISKTAALAGGLLNIKPVITTVNGEIALLGKARGSKNGSNMLKNLIAAEPVDFSKPFYLAYSGLDDTLIRKYAEDSRALYPAELTELPIARIGSVIGTHTGPGCIAAAFFCG